MKLLFILILLTLVIYILYKINIQHSPNKKYDYIQDNYYKYIKNKKTVNKDEIENTIKTGYNFQHGSENITRDKNKAEELYKFAILNGSDKSLVYLANFYHDGGINNKIDAKKALYYYGLALRKGYYECLIDVGDIYLWGLANVKQDKELAYKCYTLLHKYGDDYLKLQAQDRINQIKDEFEKKNIEEYKYNTLENTNFSNFKINYDTELVNRMFSNTNIPIKPNINEKNMINNLKLYDLSEINNTTDVDIMINERLNLQTNQTNQSNNEINVIPDRIRNDHQNVHDHVVNKTLKKSIKNLKDTTNIYISDNKSLIDIRSLINNSDSQKKDDAIKTLDYIEKKNNRLNSIDMNEIEALNLVWNRIHDPNNRDNIDNLKSNLVSELAECNEPIDKNDKESKKTQVCTTGRFSRIIDTLNMVDYNDAVKIIPKNVLNEEMMNKAAKIRNDLIENESEQLKSAINKIETNKEEDMLIENFNNKFKQNLLDTYKKDYVDSGTISEDILKSEVNKWIDHI